MVTLFLILTMISWLPCFLSWPLLQDTGIASMSNSMPSSMISSHSMALSFPSAGGCLQTHKLCQHRYEEENTKVKGWGLYKMKLLFWQTFPAKIAPIRMSLRNLIISRIQIIIIIMTKQKFACKSSHKGGAAGLFVLPTTHFLGSIILPIPPSQNHSW